MKRNVELSEISDGRLYTANDMVKADCFDCQGIEVHSLAAVAPAGCDGERGADVLSREEVGALGRFCCSAYRAGRDDALKGSAVRIEHIFFDELLGSECHVHRLFLKTLSDSAPAAVNDGSDSKLCFCHFSVILSMLCCHYRAQHLFVNFQKALICARPFVGVARSIFA